MNLYTLTNEFMEIVKYMEDLELDPEVLQDTLDSMKAPIEEKVENMVKYMKSLEALADAKKLEAKRLSESASADLKKAEFFKNYMADNLNKAGIKKLQAGVFSLAFKTGSEITVVDESKLPEEYWAVQDPVLKPIGKPQLKKLLQSGIEIPGVSLVRNPDSLVVK
jgi:FKBP-type peptidyl-prolyl cis-trans isomerase